MDFDQIPPGYRIAVVGSGAIGGYYGARLARQNRADVHFLLRSDLDHVRQNGLQIHSIDGDFDLPASEINAHGSTDDIGACDLVIIALKTTSNPDLPALLRPLLKPETLLLTLQNGLGADEFLADEFGADRILGGLCFVCINRTAPGVIEHSAQGLISIGEFSGAERSRTRALCSLLKESSIPCRVVDDLARERWRKLIWNIPFNGLSIAAGSITTDKILANPHLLALTRGLMGEVVGAARALGHELSTDVIEENIERTVVMAAYRPSSLIDFEDGREVEVESIWGEPFRRGREAGAEVGRIESLYRLIHHKCSLRTINPGGI